MPEEIEYEVPNRPRDHWKMGRLANKMSHLAGGVAEEIPLEPKTQIMETPSTERIDAYMKPLETPSPFIHAYVDPEVNTLNTLKRQQAKDHYEERAASRPYVQADARWDKDGERSVDLLLPTELSVQPLGDDGDVNDHINPRSVGSKIAESYQARKKEIFKLRPKQVV